MKKADYKLNDRALVVLTVSVALFLMAGTALLVRRSQSNKNESEQVSQNKPTAYNAYVNIAEEDIFKSVGYGEFLWDLENPYY